MKRKTAFTVIVIILLLVPSFGCIKDSDKISYEYEVNITPFFDHNYTIYVPLLVYFPESERKNGTYIANEPSVLINVSSRAECDSGELKIKNTSRGYALVIKSSGRTNIHVKKSFTETSDLTTATLSMENYSDPEENMEWGGKKETQYWFYSKANHSMNPQNISVHLRCRFEDKDYGKIWTDFTTNQTGWFMQKAQMKRVIVE